MQRFNTTAFVLSLFLIFSFSSISLAQIEITSDEVWDTDQIVNEDIEVFPCATLEINATVRMAPFRSIRVRQGATLIVDNGSITSQQFGANQAWQGIYVEGDENAPQEACTNTGYVYVINTSVISNSRGGIRTYRQEQHATNTGGVVICDNSAFINNGRSIEFFPYNFGNTASRITDCTFRVNNNYLTLGLGFIGHITAWRNHGLDISGSRFGIPLSLTSSQVFSGKRGVYFLDTSGRIFDNLFSNMSVGLEVDQEGAPSGYNHITVRQNEFRRHVVGARLISENMTITDNTFLVGSNAGGAIGLHVLQSTGFTCQYNSFEGVDTKDGNYGMQVTNLNLFSPAPTTVENNKFGNLNRGINCVGINRGPLGIAGFLVTCSQFSGNRHAIYIKPDGTGPTADDGIKESMYHIDDIECPSNTFEGSLGTDIVNTTFNPTPYQYRDYYYEDNYTPTISSGIEIATFNNRIKCEKGKVAKSGNNSSSGNFDTGLIAKQQLKGIRLFPNPATTQLAITMPAHEDGAMINISKVYIMSFTGQKIMPVIRATGNGIQADIQALPNGMYQIILLLEDGERLVKPFIKAGQ